MVAEASHDDAWEQSLASGRAQLACRFPQVDDVFADCLRAASSTLSPAGVSDYLDCGRFLGRMGRGVEPVLIFLAEWPQIARLVGEGALPGVRQALHSLARSPNGKAIAPFLQSLAGVARRLAAAEPMQHYLDLTLELMQRTSGSIHGIHQTYASPGLAAFLPQAPVLLASLTIAGLRNWVDYGVRTHADHPQRQSAYFSLQSADSRAVFQRERHGTLLVDHERLLGLGLRALWDDPAPLVPYPTGLPATWPGANERPAPATVDCPYYDADGIRLPDVLDDAHGVRGIDRYRAALAHIAGHRRWSQPLVADNFSPQQRLAIETFEDSRIETLIVRRYPGLRRIFLALHPQPLADACDPTRVCCLRHRLAMLSRAILDPQHGYRDADLHDFAGRFALTMAGGEASSQAMAALALAYLARTRRAGDQLPTVHFTDTRVDYRDDNRHLWRYHELSDDEEFFATPRARQVANEIMHLPPRHYPEWDYRSQSYRLDWVSLYESLHAPGDATLIDRLLAKHARLARRLQRLLDLLRPQDRVRVRYQEDGADLDHDLALRSLADLRSGAVPDPRINFSHRTSGRNLAVLLLLDLSRSLGDPLPESSQTILELGQEAVALLAWAIEQLGDAFAIAGFHSDTRHEVRYLHLKGFSEPWGETVKRRLAAIRPGDSTRMGAALRHAAHYLQARPAGKKLLLVLTDGQPADVDEPDERRLIEDARKAVGELDGQGIFTFCISLDRQADDYVGDIFGRRYSVIDHIERLPQRLPELFMALTR
ncbi:MAG TPA: nitric oxide reductase activation protein NorD [Accumulibacter sp.]|uniref:nitric oxide reductase activation protein NorD n=1 Tax=Accumulibacter sp. TaxID=2053492 RepID=UPI002D0BE3FB|nr:nitric oxide reductase activation protein NorD [Accumulibacter sp.]HMV04132.1 nitric oxide reductase activation protein NorD [Accumulibacter sp.]